MSADIVNFGCRLNTYEGQAMASLTAHLADTLVINTCAVTTQAERQARHAVSRAHRETPGRPIVVTGCAAQIAPQRWAALPGVTSVLGNAEKLLPTSWTREAAQDAARDANRIQVADIMEARSIPAHPVSERAGRARALVQIQQGCDHRCTFCIIPFGRGRSRSVPASAIAAQIRALAASGIHEAVLTGVDIASYGADLPGHPTLGSMIRQLLADAPHLARLRLSSLDPAAIDDDLWALIAGEPRLMPHLHLSLQAGSDLILKLSTSPFVPNPV